MNKYDGIKFQALINSISNFNLKEDGVIGSKTLWAAMEVAKRECKNRAFEYPTKGLLFLRTDSNLTNTFDDFVLRINGGVVDYVSSCSTTAGQYWVHNPVTSGGVKGTAITTQQQVKFAHKFITGKWSDLWLKAPYFQQVRPLKVYRDGNKDGVIDRVISKVGLFGINLHRGGIGNLINRWSAGCNVTPDQDWFNIITIFEHGDLIDYTLIEL